ncbi:DUF4181 domain-containing protein [Pseudalkalibacillus sp. NRS-1564]|uniref:DUF4181 domain-containing protein n=1 Tax=Pseudalkalibacillus sp. NRS-1564 TaxID=3233900 RepID=UPI003D2D5F98
MNVPTIVSLVILFAVYIWVCEYYFKRRLGIKDQTKWMMSKDRNKVAKVIDLVLVVLFIYCNFDWNVGPNSENYPVMMKISPIFALFFLHNMNQGIEELLKNRSGKSYYHYWLGSLMSVLSFLILCIDQYS